MKYLQVFITLCMTMLIFAGCAKTQKEEYVSIASAPMGITLSDALDMISEDDIRTHIKTLSADVMEGRAPGSKGGEMAAEYIASQFEKIGLEQVMEGTYFQTFPMVGFELRGDKKFEFTKNGKTLKLDFGSEFVMETALQVETVSLNEELIYLGYGVQAPELDWDDYKGVDVKGKVLLMLVNDPPSDDPNHFGGNALTYYGRWTYKFEKAAEMGAKGVILIHTTPSATYGWQVIESGFTGKQYALGLNENSPPQLAMRSWISEPAADKLLAFSGHTLSDLQAAAARRDFQPVHLGVKVKAVLDTEISSVETSNVIGIIRGSDPVLSNEMVIWSGHYDHLGIAAPNSEGDNIYNGAWDNASGVSTILAIAKVAVELKPLLKRSILVMALTAEESGLLGSKYYSENPLFHLATAKALFNIDAVNIWGETRDMNPLGFKRSTMEAMLQPIADEQNLVLVPDQSPEKGIFFRSDHFPFSKAGVPAVSIDSGNDYVGRDVEWREATVDGWINANYHQPSDEYSEDWDMAGVMQIAKFVLSATYDIANSAVTPEWNEGQEFKAVRDKSLQDYQQ